MKRVMIALTLAGLFAGCATPRQQPTPPGAAATSTAAGDTKSSSGEDLPVGAIPNAVLHDAQRNRDLELNIEYPTRGGPYPVIIFSHGYGGSNRAYTAMTEYWTSRGYVCIKPNHADAGAIREALAPVIEERRQERRSRRQQEVAPQPAGPPPPDPESIWKGQTEADYRNRAQDVTLIIDSLSTLEQKYPELKGRMDAARIGVGGHSYGALTTMMAAGLKLTKNGTFIRVGDARVKAGVAMSPQGTSADIGTSADSWSDVRIPMLYMTGSRDYGAEGQDPEWRRQAFQNSPPPEKWLVWIEGATHMSFTGGLGSLTPQEMDRRQSAVRDAQARGMDPRSIAVPGRGRGFGTIRIASLAFWDAYLKDDPKAKDRLNGFNSDNVKVEKK